MTEQRPQFIFVRFTPSHIRGRTGARLQVALPRINLAGRSESRDGRNAWIMAADPARSMHALGFWLKRGDVAQVF